MGIYGTKKDIKLGKLELSGNNIYYITSASGEAARQQTKEIFDILKRNSNASSTRLNLSPEAGVLQRNGRN